MPFAVSVLPPGSAALTPNIRTEYWERFAWGSGQYWEQANVLLVRTRIDLVNLGDELDAFFAHFEDDRLHNVYAGAIGQDTLEFANGFAILLLSSDTVAELTRKLAPLLERCDAWALFTFDGQHAESVGGGPVSTFMQGGTGTGVAIAFFSGVDETLVGELTGRVSGALKDEGRAIFHFRTGAVVAFRTRRPARMIATALVGHVRASETWIVIDHNGDDHGGRYGEPLPPGDNRLGWWRVEPEMLVYEYDGPITSGDNPHYPDPGGGG
jgi:hypothetical protein